MEGWEERECYEIWWTEERELCDRLAGVLDRVNDTYVLTVLGKEVRAVLKEWRTRRSSTAGTSSG